MSERSLVKNAADPKQVARAARKEADLERMFTEALKRALGDPNARFVFRALLERLGAFRSIWDNSARIHYNAGRQDAAHELMALIIAADEDMFDLMEREARARQKKLEREIDAAHTARASDGGTTNAG